jgi:5-methylcytosine-specific restriction enzyme subunit McrC
MDSLVVDASASAFITEAVAQAFGREVQTLAAHGLAKGYATERRTRPPYAGRIDAALHLSRFGGRPDRLVTVMRRLSTDIAENRVLALALDILGRVPLSPATSARLKTLVPVFANVARQPMRPDEAAAIVLTNLTRRYASALALAEVILRSQSLVPRSAGLGGGSILFFMPKVWEAYVATWVRSLWSGDEVRSPDPFMLTKEGLRAEADVTVWRDGRRIALYDAKYKWPDSAPDRGDLYQMVTYCDSLHLDEATLVYPGELSTRTVTVGQRRVHVVGVRPGASAAVQAGAA